MLQNASNIWKGKIPKKDLIRKWYVTIPFCFFPVLCHAMSSQLCNMFIKVDFQIGKL